MIKIISTGLVYQGAPLGVNQVCEFDSQTELNYISTGKAIKFGEPGSPTTASGIAAALTVADSTTLAAIQSSVSGGGKSPSVLLKPYGSLSANAGVLGYTLCAMMVSPVPFVAARLRMYGTSAAAVVGVTAGVAASATNTSANGISVTTGSPTQIKVGGAASWAVPAAISGGDGNDDVFSTVVSDWAPVQSVARSDGGTGYLLCVRLFQPSAGNTVGGNATPLGSDAASVNSYGVAAVAIANDLTFTNWASAQFGLTGYAPPLSVELLTTAPTRSVAIFGDSTAAGTDGYKNNAGGLTLAAMSLAGTASAVGYWNAGENVMQSTTYLANLKNAIANGLQTTALAFCPFSPNDSDKYTAAGTARQIASALEFLTICKSIGATPILLTPCPVGGLNSTQEGFRRQVAVATKQYASAFGAKLIDRDALYTDYTTTSGGWLAGMNFNFVHPSPASYALEASALWLPVIATLT